MIAICKKPFCVKCLVAILLIWNPKAKETFYFYFNYNGMRLTKWLENEARNKKLKTILLILKALVPRMLMQYKKALFIVEPVHRGTLVIAYELNIFVA